MNLPKSFMSLEKPTAEGTKPTKAEVTPKPEIQQTVEQKLTESLKQVNSDIAKISTELIKISEMRGFTGIDRENSHTLRTRSSQLDKAIAGMAKPEEREAAFQILDSVAKIIPQIITSKKTTPEINTSKEQIYSRTIIGRLTNKINNEIETATLRTNELSEPEAHSVKRVLEVLTMFSNHNAGVIQRMHLLR